MICRVFIRVDNIMVFNLFESSWSNPLALRIKDFGRGP